MSRRAILEMLRQEKSSKLCFLSQQFRLLCNSNARRKSGTMCIATAISGFRKLRGEHMLKRRRKSACGVAEWGPQLSLGQHEAPSHQSRTFAVPRPSGDGANALGPAHQQPTFMVTWLKSGNKAGPIARELEVADPLRVRSRLIAKFQKASDERGHGKWQQRSLRSPLA